MDYTKYIYIYIFGSLGEYYEYKDLLHSHQKYVRFLNHNVLRNIIYINNTCYIRVIIFG